MPRIAATAGRDEHQHDVLLHQPQELGRCVSQKCSSALMTGWRRRRPRLSVSSSTLTRGSRDRATASGRVAHNEPAGVEHADAPGQRERFGHVVGHEDHGRLQLPLNPEEFALELHTGHRIQRAERFVHQEDRRIDGERPGHADPLALAAGELRGPARRERRRRKVDQFEQRVRRARGCDRRAIVPGAARGRRFLRRSCGGTVRRPGARSRFDAGGESQSHSRVSRPSTRTAPDAAGSGDSPT